MGVAVDRAEHVASPSLCVARFDARGYPWPIRPFHEQHPVRGNFGDPRTIFFDADDPVVGAFSFHNGVDISAYRGTPVYAVETGRVGDVRPDEVIVRVGAHKSFQYWHVRPLVRRGQRVRAERTVVGRVLPHEGHVHLSEIVDGRAVNPLEPGHLTPYADSTPPVVRALAIENEAGRALSPAAVTGRVRLVAEALDEPPLRAPGPWGLVPVTPARVAWRLTNAAGRTVAGRVVADFRRTEPPKRDFWRVYAPGTFQNFPAVGSRYFFGTAGEYLFDLTPTPLDASALVTGTYRLTVSAEDTCGNTGTLSERLHVEGRPPRLDLRALARWPNRRSAWTVVLASVPMADGREPALEVARAATAAGLGPIHVVVSARYPSLRPGYRLVCSGIFAAPAQALAAARAAASLYPEAYPREIVQPRRRRWRDTRAGERRQSRAAPRRPIRYLPRASAKRRATSGQLTTFHHAAR